MLITLTIAWVARVFSTSTTLSSIMSTGDQIRRFVQAFLDARALVIPRPRRPQPRVVAEDSQESQYDYDQFDLDLDDPELLAALGEDVGTSEHAQNKEKEKAVCEVIDKVISPAIYRLVCKHFSDPAYQKPGELHFNDADNWIDCWVGCASVVVQNGKKVCVCACRATQPGLTRSAGLELLFELWAAILGDDCRCNKAAACRPPVHVHVAPARFPRVSGS